jgi:parallel beta-helix repeat protein
LWGRTLGRNRVTRRIRQLIATSAGVALVIFGLASVGAPSASALPATRFVATTGVDTANTCLVAGAPCLTLGHALAQAAAGDTIQLAAGTYRVSDDPTGTSNSVPTTLHDLTIQANPSGGTAANTIIDATGEANGLVVNANHVTVKNLTFRDADREGIIAAPPEDAIGPATVSDLTLTGDVVTNNDRCSQHPSASDCPTQNNAVLPFSQGVVLASIVDSTVTGNIVTGNWGGIGLDGGTDNTISGNIVSTNGMETVAGGGAPSGGGARFSATGILVTGGSGVVAAHGNTISGNTVNGNGSIGIFLLAGGGHGDENHDNHVTGNTVNDNWGVGIAIKSYEPEQNANGNVITGNHLSGDGIHGRFSTVSHGGAGDDDAGITQTAGILVLSFTDPPVNGSNITGTVITGNTITNEFYGVWMSARTPRENVSGNTTTVNAGGAPILVERRDIAPIVGVARTPSGHGYWEVQSDGTVFPFGDAGYFGSMGGIALAQPIVGIASTPSGHGYWLVATDGGIFSFGDAVFHGSTGAIHLNQPIVGMAAGPAGNGYWLVARDGGIFSFGSAKFHGSTGAIHLNQPVVGMAAGPAGNGYWLVASDGGIFSFASAKFHGSTGAIHLNQPIVGMAPTITGLGYWLAARDGGIFAFPDAHYFGSEPANS